MQGTQKTGGDQQKLRGRNFAWEMLECTFFIYLSARKRSEKKNCECAVFGWKNTISNLHTLLDYICSDMLGMVTMESGVAEGTSGIVCASDNGGETLLECFHVANSISLFIVILRILN